MFFKVCTFRPQDDGGLAAFLAPPSQKTVDAPFTAARDRQKQEHDRVERGQLALIL